MSRGQVHERSTAGTCEVHGPWYARPRRDPHHLLLSLARAAPTQSASVEIGGYVVIGGSPTVASPLTETNGRP
jgi:hypothetical protein